MVSVPTRQRAVAHNIASIVPLPEAVAALAVIALAILGLENVVPGAMVLRPSWSAPACSCRAPRPR
jgi:hypothetical protein